MFKTFLQNKSAILLIIGFTVVVGIVQFFSLPIALYPQATKPFLWVDLWPDGTTAQNFREQYGKNIESALENTKDVTNVTASYRPHRMQYGIEFDWGVSADDAKASAQAALAGIQSQFPDEWGRFRFYFEGSSGSQLILMVASEKHNLRELSKLITDKVESSLGGIEGMQPPWVTSFDRQKIVVEFKPDRLGSLGVSPESVYQKLKKFEFDVSLGQIQYSSSGDRKVVLQKKLVSLQTLRNFLISSKNGQQVYLRDVANIKIDTEIPKKFYKFDGKRGVLIGGVTKPDANISNACFEFIAKAKSLVHSIDPDLKLHVLLNPGNYIRSAVKNIFIAVILGVAIATFILFLFFGSLRHTLVIGVSIPLSLMGGFILMQILNIEMNLVSLGAMALAAGMVVDGGIVVFENCVRLYEIHRPQKFQEALMLVLQGVREVRAAVIASVITTVIVFAPLPFTSPIAAAILGDLAKVMVCVLSISLVVALFVLPALILMLSKNPVLFTPQKVKTGIVGKFSKCLDWFQKLYLSSLSYLFGSAKRAWFFLGSVTSVFLLALVVLGVFLETEVMPLPDSDQVFLGARYKGEKYDLKVSEKIIDAQSKKLREKFPSYIDRTLSRVKEYDGWVLTFLKDPSQSEKFKEELEKEFKNTPMLRYRVYPWVPSSLEIPDPPVLELDVLGDNEYEKMARIEEVDEILGDLEGVGNVELFPSPKRSHVFEIQMKTKHLDLTSKEFSENFTESKVASVIRSALSERKVMNMEVDFRIVPLYLTFPEKYIQTPFDIENLQLAYHGKYFPVRHFAKVIPNQIPKEISVEKGKKLARLKIWPKRTYKGSREEFRLFVTQKLAENMLSKEELAKFQVKSPMIPNLKFNDADKEINDNLMSLLKALAIALMLVLVVICLQFANLTQTFVIMLAVPLGVIGVSFSLFIFGVPLSVNSMLGIILLAGTAVNNSIVFVDFYKNIGNSKPHASLKEKLLHTAEVRFRPILITTMTTVLGMVPIAIGMGEGGEIMQPLGIAVCGGLFISTALTMLLVPLMLYLLENRSFWPLKPIAVSSAVLIFLGLSFAPQEAKALDLDLPAAEKILFSNHTNLKNAELDIKIARDQKYSAVGDFLPEISYGRLKGLSKSTGGKWKSNSNQKGWRIRQSLSAPLLNSLEVGKRRLNQRSMELDFNQTVSNEVSEMRTLFWKIWVFQKNLNVLQKMKKITDRYYNTSKNKYDNGLVGKDSYLRAKNSKFEIETELKSQEQTIWKLKSDLLAVLHISNEKPQNLNLKNKRDFVPKIFGFTESQWVDLEKKVNNGTRVPIEKAQIELKKSQLGVMQSGRNFLPEIVAEYQYLGKDKSNVGTGSQVSVGFEWTVFRGGKNFFEMRERVNQKHKAKNTLERAEISFANSFRGIKAQILNAKRDRLLQKERVKNLRQIVALSTKKYEQGYLDAMDLSRDIQVFGSAQIAENNAVLAVLTNIQDFVKLSANHNLFHQLL